MFTRMRFHINLCTRTLPVYEHTRVCKHVSAPLRVSEQMNSIIAVVAFINTRRT